MEWFNNIRIRNKLFIAFGILLSVAAFFAIFAVVGITKVGDSLEELINSYQMRQIHLAEAIADVYRIRLVNISKGYLLEDDLKEIVSELNIDLDENIELFTNSLLVYRNLIIADARLTPEEKRIRLDFADDIMGMFDGFVEITRDLDAAVMNNDKQEMVLVIEESITAGNELSRNVKELRDRIFVTTREKAAETQAVAVHMIHIISGVSVVFILSSAVIMLFTIRNIDKPITKLEKAMEEIANGNLSYPIRIKRKDELGALANCIGDMIDEIVKLSERKQQEELLLEALTAAKLASAAKSSFLANMSHEIRTPMNVVLGITEILLQNETLTPDVRDALGKIYNSGDLLLSLINDILDLSKIEAGKLELAPHKYDVASLINDTVTLNMMKIGSKQIEFVLSVDENTPSALTGDDLRIKQILNNLLSNAFKYTNEGIVKLTISAQTGSGGSSGSSGSSDSPGSSGSLGSPGDAGRNAGGCVNLVFTVADTGQGMSQEQLERIFDEYSRFNTEANRMTEGTGLGMSILQNLVDMMNGDINIESEVGKGTVFTVYLPQESASSGVLGKELTESLQSFKLNDLKQFRKAQIVYEPMPYGKILIVDDAETNLYVARGLMAPYGLSIDTAGSGFEAIAIIKSGKVYDIVFMDHMMPAMDGIETTGQIRELGYTHPIIALTANAVAGQEAVFLTNGFDGFISKPIDMRQLSAALKKYVRDKHARGFVVHDEVAHDKTAYGTDVSVAPAQPLIHLQLAESFIRDANRSSSTLEGILGKGGVFADEDILLYTTTVHAMKSALANVGEKELSACAAKLEQAGREKDTDMISAHTPIFLDRLQAVVLKLTPHESKERADVLGEGDGELLAESMHAVKTACLGFDKRSIKEILTELRQKTWPQEIEQLLGEMSGQLLDGDFSEVSHTAETIMEIPSPPL